MRAISERQRRRLSGDSDHRMRRGMKLKAAAERREHSIQGSLKFALMLAQIFGLFPLRRDPIHFKWCSFKVAYSGCVLILYVIMLCTGVYHFVTVKTELAQIVEIVFQTRAFVTAVMFFKLATVWPQLMTDWGRIDTVMQLNYGYPKILGVRLKISAFAMMFFAAVEHLLSLAYHVVSTSQTFEGNLTFNNYYHSVYPQIFEHVPLSYFTAILVQVMSAIGTFSWNYNDLFIILTSVSLALRFRQISQRMKKHERESSIAYWMEVREDYDRLSNLCRKLDAALSFLVLNSFATNIFFILVQLFYSLRPITDNVEKIYFFYSFGFLIIRTVAVALYGAGINTESKEPLNTLNSVPSNCYNDEVRRFTLQISNDTVALTGCQIFRVTRGLILNVAGAIVTYELVLIQFNFTALHNNT